MRVVVGTLRAVDCDVRALRVTLNVSGEKITTTPLGLHQVADHFGKHHWYDRAVVEPARFVVSDANELLIIEGLT